MNARRKESTTTLRQQIALRWSRRAFWLSSLNTAVVGIGLVPLFLQTEAMARRTRGQEPVLPESRGAYTFTETQRLRYKHTPLYRKAHAAIKEERYDEAEASLLEVLKSDPHNNTAKVYLVEVYNDQAKWEQGIALCDELLEYYPDYLDMYLNKGYMCLKNEELDRGIRAFQTFLDKADKRHEKRRSIQQELIDTYVRSEQWILGIEACEQIIEEEPQDLEVYLTKAYIALQIDQPALAIRTLKSILNRVTDYDPKMSRIQSILAEAYFKLGEFSLAEKHANLWLECEDALPVRLFLAESAIKRNDWSSALEQLDAATQHASSPEERGKIHLKRGYMLTNLGRFGEAEQAFLDAQGLLSDPKQRIKIMHQLGLLSHQQKAYTRAADYFERYLDEEFDEDVGLAFLETLSALDYWYRGLLQAQAMLSTHDLSKQARERALGHLMLFHKHLGNETGTYLVAMKLVEETNKTRYLIEAARAAVRLNRWNAADRLYERYLAYHFDPQVAFDHYYVVKTLNEQEKGKKILSYLMALEQTQESLRNQVRYEMAQVAREEGRLEDYFSFMNKVTEQRPSTQFFLEYADQLYMAGEHERAAELYIQSLKSDGEVTHTKYATSKTLAEIFLLLKKPDMAHRALDLSFSFGDPQNDPQWHYIKGRTEYAQGNYQACVDRLLPTVNAHEAGHLYLGFAFYRLDLPGLSLNHFNRVKDPDALPAEQRRTFYANRAYLRFAQDQFDAALNDVENALSIKFSDELAIVRLKTLLRLGRCEQVVQAGEALLRDQAPPSMHPKLQALLARKNNAVLEERIWSAVQSLHAQVTSQIHETLGQCRANQEEHARALEHFSKALALNSHLKHLYYLRGLAYAKLGRKEEAERDFMFYFEQVPTIPRTYWGDLGQVQGQLADYETGTSALKEATVHYKYDIDSLEELGYQYLKWNKTQEAKETFKRAIDVYDEVITYLDEEEQRDAALEDQEQPHGQKNPGQAIARKEHRTVHEKSHGEPLTSGPLIRAENSSKTTTFTTADTPRIYYSPPPTPAETGLNEYEENRLALKREYSKLDKTWGAQAYLTRTDYDFERATGERLASIDGALPSQAGILASYRPPEVGFRHEKTLDGFVRVLSNLEPDSFSPEEDSYQGGAGLAYKPFTEHNFTVSLERLFKIGDDAENNWLWRNMYAWEQGEKPKRDQEIWPYAKAYGEVSYFLDDPDRWITFLDLRLGPSFSVGTHHLVTFPQVMGSARYQSNDTEGIGTYSLVGAGGQLRILEGEHQYTTERWYVDLFAHYTWGWFRDEPDGLNASDFDGLVFGVNFVK